MAAGSKVQEVVDEARDLMESFDENTHAITVGFESPTYTLTGAQMTLIAGALYLADCEINKDNE